jgi:phage terminase large subunit
VNEAIHLEWETYRQLAVRTTEKIILDYNPAYEFWVDSKLAPRADVRIITSTYKDNDMLTASQISEIESNEELDPEWWKVYGLGQTGSKAGLVIKNWDIVQAMPPRSEWKKAFIGVDFGWSNPTAVMLVVLAHGDLWIDELAYEKNLDNPDIAALIKACGHKDLEIIADPAEPKSIKELRTAGLNVAEKGIVKDIKLGLRVLNRYKKHYTARSLGSIDENRKYRYPQDAEGNYVEDLPIDKHNHAKDAERYVALNRLSNISTGFDVTTSARSRKT